MDSFNSSYVGIRYDLLKFVEGESLTILDIGCATGMNGLFLKERRKASLVIGVEYDESMAVIAEKNIDKVIIGDLNTMDIRSEISGGRFDYIILGDILEHLVDPWNVLTNLVALMENNGKLVISFPNIQHIETFIQIYLHSNWPYNKRGIFDKTHLRFFTYKNMVDIVDKSNLTIINMERIFRFRDNGAKFPLIVGKLLKLFFPNIFTFQYIIVCGKK